MKVLLLSFLGYMVWFSGCTSYTYAQNLPDTMYQLPGVNVVSTGSKSSTGLKCQSLDSSDLHSGSLGDKLSQHTTAFIRSAGPGNLASISLRGTSSQQTAILWNGFDIRATGAGMIDFSLLPAIVFDEVTIISGGNSALHGSGAMGGSLLLKTETVFSRQRELRAGFMAGSFHSSSGFIQVRQGTQKLGISLTGFCTRNKNDFPYQQNNEPKINSHAAQRQTGMMAEFGWKPYRNQQFRLSAWVQDSWREIPPSLTSINMNAERRDRSYRFIPEWKLFAGSGVFKLKAAVFHDDLHYLEKPDNSLISLDSRILNDLHSVEFGYSRSLRNHLEIDAGLRFSSYVVDLNTYGGVNSSQESSLWLSLQHTALSGKVISSLNFRLLQTPSHRVIPIASAGMDFKILPHLLWNVSLSGNYRLPALNDLYWIPGGNPKLQPEQSRNAETGLKWYLTSTDNKIFEFHTNLFYSDFHDYIAWIPGSPYFYAANIRKVNIQGSESGFSLQIPLLRIQVKSGLDYSWLQSRYRNALNSLDESLGKQLIYVPQHRLNFNSSLTYKRFSLKYFQNYTGKVFVTSDNSTALKAWSVSNAVLTARFSLNRLLSLQSEIEIRNIWNAEYQVVQYYPMPGRSVYINILLIIK